MSNTCSHSITCSCCGKENSCDKVGTYVGLRIGQSWSRLYQDVPKIRCDKHYQVCKNDTDIAWYKMITT